MKHPALTSARIPSDLQMDAFGIRQSKRSSWTDDAYRESEGQMAKLRAKARKALPSSEFGLPGKRAYPVNDRSHAANAKARATQMVNRGKLSGSQAAEIRAKANRVLGK